RARGDRAAGGLRPPRPRHGLPPVLPLRRVVSVSGAAGGPQANRVPVALDPRRRAHALRAHGRHQPPPRRHLAPRKRPAHGRLEHRGAGRLRGADGHDRRPHLQAHHPLVTLRDAHSKPKESPNLPTTRRSLCPTLPLSSPSGLMPTRPCPMNPPPRSSPPPWPTKAASSSL